MTLHRPGQRLVSLATTAIVTLGISALAHPAAAQTTPPATSPPTTPPATTTPAPATPAAAAPAAPASWQSTITYNAQIDAGVTLNPQGSGDGLNYGDLFNDRTNSVLLNQLLLTAQRPLDPKATDYDVGFKLQFMYGTDARYTHFIGELDRVTSNRMQLDIVEANVSVHTPWLTEGGIDFKIGQFSTPEGYETIDPSNNPFYSHSYIFAFGLPFKQTGAYAVTHLNGNIDVYTGVDTGEQTSFGGGDNNSAIAGMLGVNLTLLGGNLTMLALSHFGPENPTRSVPDADGYSRYENDAVITYKATPALTFVTEVNWIHDDKFHADAYGGAQYASYTLNPQITLNARAEIYRDQNNFFVAGFPNSLGFVNAEEGYPYTAVSPGKGTTYGEVTLGFTYKPTVPAPVANLAIRPEIRYDSSLNGTKPYNNNQNTGAFTIAADVILGF
jgi:hypothetical protein